MNKFMRVNLSFKFIFLKLPVFFIFIMIFLVSGNEKLYALDYTVHSKRSDYLEVLGKTIPSNYIQTLAADPEEPSIILIGTNKGLTRYNGKTFRTYGADSGA